MLEAANSVLNPPQDVDGLRLACCRYFAALLAVTCPSWVILWVYLGYYWPAAAVLLCGLCGLVAFHQALSPKGAVNSANILCFSVVLSAFANSIATGGWESPIHFCMVMVPMLSMLLIGWNASIVWSAVVLVAVSAIYVQEWLGFHSPPLAREQRLLAFWCLEITVIVGMVSLTFIYRRMLELLLKIKERQASELERAIQRKKDFLAHVAHEIRTPLHGLLALTGLLASESTPPPDWLSQLEKVHSCGDMLLCLVNNVLDLSAIEAGVLRVEPKPTCLRPLVGRCFELLRTLAAQKSSAIACHLSIDPNVPDAAVLDQLRLTQALVNLAGNAVKFTEAGSIDISLSLSGEDLVFLVSDTGVGIPEAFRAKLFLPYELLRPSKGTGLGLAISRLLIGMMGGTIGLRDSSERGSIFYFTLPYVPVPPQTPLPIPAPMPSLADLQSRRERARLLLVEDNKLNQAVALKYLRKLGYDDARIATAVNGLEAVELCQSNSYDIILMDCQMPVMDGWEATRKIRSDCPLNRGSRICAVTASSTDAEREHALSAGMDCVLLKPFKPEQLDEIIWGGLR